MEPARHPDVTDATATMAVQLLQQTHAATYIASFALTVSTWDWALTLGEEFRILNRCGRGPAVLAYFVARTSAVITCVLSLIFLIKVPPDNNMCSALITGIGLMAMTGSAAKTYLFLIRIRAIYGNTKIVTFLSGVAWLAVVCARMTVAFRIQVSPMVHTGRCAVTNMGSIPIFSIWLNLAYDTCIFLLISVRLTSYTKFRRTPGIPSFIRGYGLPHTMRHLLQDGQFYYFITMFFTLLAAVIAVSAVSPIYQAIFSVPAYAIEVIMTCKIFRAMILRSLDRAQDVDINLSAVPAESSTTAMSIFELDTVLEHRIRTMNIEYER
ncbi:hypothetical protein FIBSPDRAFT_1013563 [Athelia psychrophila]|uniref:Uncharacterized protein n=1 Tax=Athelia psychrophila TaxID=1759441 RepID=A0A166M7G2_9AGAM|nr:hypothetical protein FIBSPDRAFT_1013563 [Fibularhizoctonia sp. CBS 109695]